VIEAGALRRTTAAARWLGTQPTPVRAGRRPCCAFAERPRRWRVVCGRRRQCRALRRARSRRTALAPSSARRPTRPRRGISRPWRAASAARNWSSIGDLLVHVHKRGLPLSVARRAHTAASREWCVRAGPSAARVPPTPRIVWTRGSVGAPRRMLLGTPWPRVAPARAGGRVRSAAAAGAAPLLAGHRDKERRSCPERFVSHTGML